MFFMLIQALKHTGFCGCKDHSLFVNKFGLSYAQFFICIYLFICRSFLLALNRASLFAKKDCQGGNCWLDLLSFQSKSSTFLLRASTKGFLSNSSCFVINTVSCLSALSYRKEKKRKLCRIFWNQVSRSLNFVFVKHAQKLQRYPHKKRVPIRPPCPKFVRWIIISLPILRLEDFPGLYSLQCWQKTQAGSSEEEMVYNCESAPKMSVIYQVAFKLT